MTLHPRGSAVAALGPSVTLCHLLRSGSLGPAALVVLLFRAVVRQCLPGGCLPNVKMAALCLGAHPQVPSAEGDPGTHWPPTERSSSSSSSFWALVDGNPSFPHFSSAVAIAEYTLRFCLRFLSSRGPEDTCFEFGVFPAILSFPLDYPLSPPKMRFTCEMFHPNIYPDGRVCISILHAPGDDPMGYESSAERWSPVQSVEKILLSVVSMLAEPNDESGANVDASKMWRDDREQFYRIARQIVQKSLGL
ncbi:Hypothetical predicted protein [Marmota monax]|uniref:Ubiquitin-conjugating enzyme E2 G2 n=2 Tax=Marmotini TaxID=337730 RepID=A0A5E4D2J9_MARMO|nr:ubiquitin-conjugating enzyme E2 G2 [Marmota monax]VTJ87421.1 Hypothetical predicted protein [Marmota monax]